MKILWVLTYPLALFLDWLLGTHSLKRFEKNDLKALIELHEIKKKEKSGFHNEKDENHEVFYYRNLFFLKKQRK